MAEFSTAAGPDWGGLNAAVEARAGEWIAALHESPSSDGLLAGMRRDPDSFDFTRRLFELVAGTDDPFASAMGLRDAAQDVPASMPVRDQLAVRVGGAASLGLPWAIMPVARRWLRERVGDLVLSTKLPETEPPGRLNGLAEAVRRFTERGLAPVIAPLGDGVHGPSGVQAEANRLAALAAHPSVAHLVVDPARFAPGGSDWSAELDASQAAEALRPVLAAAAEHGTTIELEARSVRWTRLLPEICERALGDPSLDRARVGIRLPAELPESRELYDRFSRWAQRRVAEGGAPSEVAIGVAGFLGAERVSSLVSGLAVPVLEDHTEVSAQLLRLIDLALHPGRAAVLRPVIASEDLWALAAASTLAEDRGLSGLYSVRIRSGVAPGLAEMLAERVGEVRVLAPVAAPKEYSGAVAVLVAFAAEAADPDSDISRFEALLAENPADPTRFGDLGAGGRGAARLGTEGLGPQFAGESERFVRAAALATEPAPTSHRTQNRAREWDPSERDSALFYRAPDEPTQFETGGLTAAVLGLGRGDTGEMVLAEFAPSREIPVISESGFANEPETDASVGANREWVRELLRRAAVEAEEHDPVNDTVALSAADLDPDAAAGEAREAAELWSSQPHRTRAVLLRRSALAIVAARDRLLQSLAVETGAPISELDAQVDDLVDAARYAGGLADGLTAVRGATFAPDALVLVAADAGTPFGEQGKAVLAALAAGSGVLWAVPQRLYRSARTLVEECEVGGLTHGAVRLEAVAVGRTLPELAAESTIDRAVVFGDRAAAHELSRLRPGLRIEGHFRECGSVLVTPTADPDATVPAAVASALRGAGGDPRATHLLILLGSAGRSKRLRAALADRVRALRPGDIARPGDGDPLSFDLGPLPAPPEGAALRALTELGKGEEWLVVPEQLDESGLLWSAGVRWGVSPASTFWSDARGLPLIGVIHAHTIEEAIELQNTLGGGAAAGLFSNDEDEILNWIEGVEAASISINRATTDARIERQPGGGWNAAVAGMPALSGGPNWLVAQGSWSLREGTPSETLHLRGLEPEVQLLIEAAQPNIGYREFDEVRRAALADALTWRTSMGVMHDAIGLGIERNALRYWPVATRIRLAEGGSLADLVRVLSAALLVRAPITVSTGEVLPPEISHVLAQQGIEVSLERDEDWLERLAVDGSAADAAASYPRMRLIGGDRVRAAEWLGGPDRAALWAEPVTMAGSVELLTLLREQSISARANRHGLAVAVPGIDELLS